MKQLGPWELLMKRLTWQQLGPMKGKRILDFGSGEGITADYFAADNEVVAIEPDRTSVEMRSREHLYVQLTGSTERLRELPDASFDVVLCHCVLEYAPDRERIVRELARLIKTDGQISILKHNRPGRVMQMAVLLNNFDAANALLSGGDGSSAKYGTIHYYEDDELARWCPELEIQAVRGLRVFFDLQQNQEIQRDPKWQERMLALEMRVSELEPYRSAAFLHHVSLRKLTNMR